MTASPWLSAGRHAANVITLAALIVILYREREAFAQALDMTPGEFGLIAGFSAASWVAAAAIQFEMVKALSGRISFGGMMVLQLATGLLNQLPARLGTFYRAHVLKQSAGLSYAHFGVVSLINVLTMFTASGLIGALAVTAFYGVREKPQLGLLLGFLSLAIGGVIPLVLVPSLRSGKRWSGHWNRFLDGRSRILADRALVARLFGWHVISFVLNAVRFSVAFGMLGVPVGVGGAMVLGAVGRLALLLGLTPGALGVQEFVVAAGAYLLGVPFSTSVVAATVVRAVSIVCYVACGVPSLMALRTSGQAIELREARTRR